MSPGAVADEIDATAHLLDGGFRQREAECGFQVDDDPLPAFEALLAGQAEQDKIINIADVVFHPENPLDVMVERVEVDQGA